MLRSLLRFSVLVSSMVLAGCGSSGGDAIDTSGSASGGSAGSGSGQGGGLGGNFGSGGSGTTGSAGGSEVCDGVDNDNNGVIDDVDAGGDGICDCLRIATLGLPGQWGQGDVFSTWLDERSDNGAVDLAGEVLTKEVLDQHQVIVAQDLNAVNRAYAPEEAAALAAWVQAGGGFMTLIGYAGPTEIVNVNTLLSTFGMSYTQQQILQKGSSSTVPITNWVAHPVTTGVTQIGVDNGYPVAGSGTTLATEQGYDLLKAQEVGAGHVLMWGDEWITYDSEWTGHPEYQVEVFWINAIKWLTPAMDCQVPIPEPK